MGQRPGYAGGELKPEAGGDPANPMEEEAQLPTDNQLLAEIAALRDGQCSVILATVGADGEPNAGYAPYARAAEGQFLVLLSGLARHCRDLLETRRVSLLFIEPESEARQVFARRRLTCRCAAIEVARGSDGFDEGVNALSQRFGAIVDTLGELSDFRLFRLDPQSARYVRGFGQAYELEGPGLSKPVHVRPRSNDPPS
jgi:putative heme iron utilization protein